MPALATRTASFTPSSTDPCPRGRQPLQIDREAARRDPEIIFASWCGKRMRKATIQNRPGWKEVSAVSRDNIYEIKSTYILQPGPASLTEGVRQLHAVLASIERPPG